MSTPMTSTDRERTYYKAVRPDGTDFFTGTVQWAPPEGHEGPWEVRHPTGTRVAYGEDGDVDYSTCLCLSDAPADCVGFKWPARLLVVEAPDAVHDRHHKWVVLSARVVGERPAHEALGPNGAHVTALIERIRRMTVAEALAAGDATRGATRGAARDAARDATRDAAGNAVWDAAWGAARGAARRAAGDVAWVAARGAIRDAAQALVVRDLITREDYDTLTRPLRLAGVTVHPDDPEVDA